MRAHWCLKRYVVSYFSWTLFFIYHLFKVFLFCQKFRVVLSNILSRDLPNCCKHLAQKYIYVEDHERFSILLFALTYLQPVKSLSCFYLKILVMMFVVLLISIIDNTFTPMTRRARQGQCSLWFKHVKGRVYWKIRQHNTSPHSALCASCPVDVVDCSVAFWRVNNMLGWFYSKLITKVKTTQGDRNLHSAVQNL